MSDISKALNLLEKLVGFPTASHRSNRALVAFMSDYLTELGVEHHVFPDETGEKEGLIAHIGPQVEGAVILSGHTDVVPTDGQSWQHDPWTLTLEDGRYYGRGTCDMKGFLALVLAAVPQMLAQPLVRPIQLAFSYDEEPGCLGTLPLIDALAQHYPRAESVIVGEPTQMKVVTGHKGGIGIKTTLRGLAAHSSNPGRGVSAIAHALPLIDWHQRQMEQEAARARPSGFDPAFTTLQVGTLHGGTALNTVPDVCVFESDIRYVPPQTADDWVAAYRAEAAKVEAAMQARHPEASVTLSDIDIAPALAPEPGNAAEELVRRLTGDNSDTLVAYQTEAGHFQGAGYATVVCGPGSITQAHQADEYITADELRRGADFLSKLIDSLR
ncbi:acetylornithine deacetylase [Sulfitobacter dubius]|uniref:Acetylornithine deacetylase n=1 Tax=Sulfitobacter dubius TaxID=218673 RepID=A0ABY3ZRU1_9RHOB|nr:acetylornithine deacetylase [Sulfitobacter dubius]UOA16854.1 Acetylornithine deacetylase [Sulfitobacter dubius]